MSNKIITIDYEKKNFFIVKLDKINYKYYTWLKKNKKCHNKNEIYNILTLTKKTS